MSKAFTRESDDQPDRLNRPRPSSLLPPGARNYLTPDGARRFREELEHLLQSERPQAPALPGPGDQKHQLSIVDQRIKRLQLCLQSAEVVHPPSVTESRIRFGATVTVRDSRGANSRYRIVGVDEVDLDRSWVSWLSPVAKALLNKE